jgi:putative transposase
MNTNSISNETRKTMSEQKNSRSVSRLRVNPAGIVNLGRVLRTDRMKTRRSRYYGHRFPAEIISHAVWLYHRFCLSFRDVEDLLAERCIVVTYRSLDYIIRSDGSGGLPTARDWPSDHAESSRTVDNPAPMAQMGD